MHSNLYSPLCVENMLSPRRCRCHACRQRRAAELRRALERKFSHCRGLSRPFAPPVQAGATAQPLETAAR